VWGVLRFALALRLRALRFALALRLLLALERSVSGLCGPVAGIVGLVGTALGSDLVVAFAL
jgi:hypothetical protein